MVSLEQEPNIDVVREYAFAFQNEVKRLAKEIAELRDAKFGTGADDVWLSRELEDQLSILRKKFFGFGRETLPSDKDRPVGHEQQKLKLHGERLHTPSTSTQGAAGRADSESAEARKETVDHKFSAEELIEESRLREVKTLSQDAWSEMKNFYQESVEITVTERIYKKVTHRQAKYRLKDEYNDTGKEVIITAPGPVKIKPGCQYSVDFALATVIDKYEFHMPLERQRRKMEGAGFEIDVKTLFTLCESVADHCLKAVLPKIKQDIMADFCAVHLDETPWSIIGNKEKGQMWILSNRIGSYYQFEPTRSGKIAMELLKDYEGGAITDAFSGYNRIKRDLKMRLGHCWSHARREFFDRLEDYEKPVTEIVRMIDELFAIESRAGDFDELRQLRKTESRELISKIQAWLLDTRAKLFPNEGLTKAIDYVLGHWTEFTLFLQDLSIPLSNNDAERGLRHAVMGRKNFMGSKTINGADVTATLYTVIESAKKVGLNAGEYLKYVITENWYKREPKSPAEISVERFGLNTRPKFPAKSAWQV